MEDCMTDKQLEIILNLVADKFSACKDMDEVKKAIEEVKEMAKKEKSSEKLRTRGTNRRQVCYCLLFKKERVVMPKGDPSSQMIAFANYQKKVGLITKSYKIRKALADEFAEACRQAFHRRNSCRHL